MNQKINGIVLSSNVRGRYGYKILDKMAEAAKMMENDVIEEINYFYYSPDPAPYNDWKKMKSYSLKVLLKIPEPEEGDSLSKNRKIIHQHLYEYHLKPLFKIFKGYHFAGMSLFAYENDNKPRIQLEFKREVKA